MAKKYRKVVMEVDKFYEKIKKDKNLTLFQKCLLMDKYLTEKGL